MRTILETVLGPPGSVGPTMMAEMLKVVYGRCLNPAGDDNCALDPNERSYFVGQGDSTQITLCDRAIKRPRLSLGQTNCKLIGSSASADTMEVIGSLILHEILHWGPLTDQKIGFHVDWDPDEVEDEDHIPPDGCDAYNAWQLNVRGKSSEQNADSYAMFAAESWYAVRCEVCSVPETSIEPVKAIQLADSFRAKRF